jgi:uncharacterized SAM-binding protein YcdF (DUF218 family)
VRTLLRRLVAFGGLFLLVVVLPSWPPLRVRLWQPLVMDSAAPQGEAAYVLGAGPLTLHERLSAAAELYHRGRVARLVIPSDPTPARSDPASGEARTAETWARASLACLGVPADRISTVTVEDGALGTAAEARAVAAAFPNVRRWVLVSSPMHLRRAHLAFTRLLAEGVAVTPVASSAVADGPDFHRPLWLEYLKLAVYAVAVWR